MRKEWEKKWEVSWAQIKGYKFVWIFAKKVDFSVDEVQIFRTDRTEQLNADFYNISG
jgi:hypothetical protein